MPLSPSRRELLRRAAMAAVVAATSGCGPDRAPGDTDSGPTVPEVPEDWPTEWRKSVCRFCGTGCGVELGTRGGKLVALRGDAAHPTTLGLVCAKSLFLPKVVNSPDRLTSPMIRRDGRLVQVTWDRAMTEISDRFAAAIREHGQIGRAHV